MGQVFPKSNWEQANWGEGGGGKMFFKRRRRGIGWGVKEMREKKFRQEQEREREQREIVLRVFSLWTYLMYLRNFIPMHIYIYIWFNHFSSLICCLDFLLWIVSLSLEISCVDLISISLRSCWLFLTPTYTYNIYDRYSICSLLIIPLWFKLHLKRV